MSSPWIEKLSRIATRFSEQRHVRAIRAALYGVIPLILVASVFVLLNNVLWRSSMMVTFFELSHTLDVQALLLDIGDRGYRGTLGIFSLLVAFLIGYHLYLQHGPEESDAQRTRAALSSGMLSLASLILFFPSAPSLNINGNIVSVWGLQTFEYTGASGLFVAFITALCSTEIYLYLNKKRLLHRQFTHNIPPSVAYSFSILVPSFLTLVLMGLIASLLNLIAGTTLQALVVYAFQQPLIDSLQTLPGVLLFLFVQNFLWTLGIHGPFILGPITDPPLLVALEKNIQAATLGNDIPYLVTKPFLDSFTMMGGSGNTISLILALLLISRRPDRKLIAHLAFFPALFNINEPLIFGLPILFNPIFAIPFVLSPLVNVILAYYASLWGFVSYVSVLTPWTTPPLLSAYLSTGGDWRAFFVALLTILISAVIYAPFVLADNNEHQARSA